VELIGVLRLRHAIRTANRMPPLRMTERTETRALLESEEQLVPAIQANRRAQSFTNPRSVILSESFPFACEWKAGVEGPLSAHRWRRRFPILGFKVRGTDRGPSTATCDSQANRMSPLRMTGRKETRALRESEEQLVPAIQANRRAQSFTNLRSVILSGSFPFACEWKAGVEGPLFACTHLAATFPDPWLRSPWN